MRSLLAALALSTLPLAISAQSLQSGIPLVVQNVPFTAQEWTTSTFVLADGTTATALRRVDIARSSAGAGCRNLRTLASNDPAAQPTGSVYVVIQDVPNRRVVNLDPATGIAAVSDMPNTRRVFTTVPSVPAGARPLGSQTDLGAQSIAGYNATGTRQVVIFPAGTKSPSQDVLRVMLRGSVSGPPVRE